MRLRPAFYVALAVLLAGSAGVLRLSHRGAPRTNLVSVVVLAKDFPAGSPLGFEDLSQLWLPERQVFASFVHTDAAAQLVGTRLKVAGSAGEPLRWQDVATPALSGTVNKRGRAVTIDVDEHRAVDGRLERDDHLDVMITVKDPQTDALVTRTLIENVVVLAVTHRPAPALESLTLLVLEEEAEVLMLSQDLGRFSLSLRNPEDAEAGTNDSRATLNTLLSGQRWFPIHPHPQALGLIRSAPR